MSSRDGAASFLRRTTAPAVAGAMMLLSACTVQPVYGPTPSGAAVPSVLASIAVDPVERRAAQLVRNKVLFDLNGGADPANPVYRMSIVATTNETPLGITREESAPVYSITVAATYEISKVSDGEIVLRATSRGTASYTRVNQIFANVRARKDAEETAARAAADDIRIRVAAAAARGVI
jgi:LPS-assembly lipoprotein